MFDRFFKKVLIWLLARVDAKKPYGTALFDALARLTVSVSIEAVCLRFNRETGEVQVYLTQRSLTDTAHPGEWHCPGSIYRPGETEEDVFLRLEEKEFDSILFSRTFVRNVMWQETRGSMFSTVWLCTLVEDSVIVNGRWFSVDNLPQKTVDGHRERIIPLAVSAFMAKLT